jgi:hypothetical protein
VARKLPPKEKAKRAAARLEARGQKFRDKTWEERHGPALCSALYHTHLLLNAKAWRESAPEHIQKARPLIAELNRALATRKRRRWVT